jgi:DNA/RNA-binding domain of Phe-tRNA-synthetase-like protein
MRIEETQPTRIQTSMAVAESYPDVDALGYRVRLSTPEPSAELDLADELKELRDQWRGSDPNRVRSHPQIAAYSEFFRRIGLNPEETPPSIQMLIERFLLPEDSPEWPRIHPIVDATNIAAAETVVPLGVFDAGALDGLLRLALTDGGEWFHPIGADEPTTLPSDVLVFRDEEDALSQFAYRDSEKQKITASTEEVWVLGCAVEGITQETVVSGLDRALELLQRRYDITPE